MAIERSDPRPRLLIISNDMMDEKMGGPGLRYMQISQAICADVDITLAVPNQTSITIPGVKIVAYQEDRASSLKSLVDAHEIVLISGYMAIRYPFLYQVKARLIVDLYDPFFLENMFYYLEQPLPEQVQRNQTAIEATNRLLQLGDFFICGTERQRDFWLGMLAANGRINPHTFTQDFYLTQPVGCGGGWIFQPPCSLAANCAGFARSSRCKNCPLGRGNLELAGPANLNQCMAPGYCSLSRRKVDLPGHAKP